MNTTEAWKKINCRRNEFKISTFKREIFTDTYKKTREFVPGPKYDQMKNFNMDEIEDLFDDMEDMMADQEEIQEMIEEADRDNDGEIGEEEFIRIMKKTNLFWVWIDVHRG